jgi:hypothetical protein
MNKKTMIELVIVVVAFGAAGLVLYNGIFSAGNDAALQSEAARNAPAGQQDILPYGTALNFDDAVNPSRFQYNQMSYPQVDKSEIKKPISDFVTPLPVVVPTK